MKKQLTVGIVVFGVGFGIGLGLTYLLLAKGTAQSAPQEAVADVPAEAESMPDSPSEEIENKGSETEALAQKGGTETPSEPASKQAPDGNDGDKRSPPNNQDSASGTVTPTEVAIKPTTATKPTPEQPEAIGDESDPALDKPVGSQWWEGLSEKMCTVQLGNARALIVRQGGLKDGELVNWMARFGRNPRIGLLTPEDNSAVLVHGVGVDPKGLPVAAMITFEKQGRKTTGIIALHVQGLKVSLKPISEKN